jgi:hypothetical protein
MRLKQKSLRQFYRLAIIFSLFRRGLMPEEAARTVEQLDEEKKEFKPIRCPLCQWQPSVSSEWACADCWDPEYFLGGCGMAWNTFATRGLCPGCGHQWRWTACLRCYEWSLHEDWYPKEID